MRRAFLLTTCFAILILVLRTGYCQDKTYEMTQEDFTSAKSIRSTDISLFGIKLGANYEDVKKAVAASGRPSKEHSGLGATDLMVFFAEEELSKNAKMITFEAEDQVVKRIFVYGAPYDMVARTATPIFRGFDSIAIGSVKTLLTKCNSDQRIGILGREDRKKDDKFLGDYITDYYYDKEGLIIHQALTHEPETAGQKLPKVNLACTLILVQPARQR